MSKAKQKDNATILWWVGWIVLTILSFFISSWFWTGFIARHVGSMQKPGVPILWVAAVFGSWMLLLVPLIIVMYAKVDKAYEDARIARASAEFKKTRETFKVRSQFIDPSERKLEKKLIDKLKAVPETIKRGHLVTAILNDGRRIQNVFILNKKEVLGVYGIETLNFDIRGIVDLEPSDLGSLPHFNAEEWLRLVGVGA